MISQKAAGVRAVERTIEIAAPVSAVWHALIDPVELTRWFPLEARVTPGLGGSVWMRWSDGNGEGGPIEIWEPERHLRTGSAGDGPVHIATDYYLAPKSGSKTGTVLRVVSSGFEADEKWDELYEAWGRGWDFELRGLRHYLEKHPGKERNVAQVHVPFRAADSETWAKLVGPRGWLGDAGLTGSAEGSRYSVLTTSGETLSGVVHTWQPPHQFSGTVEGWNDALLRIQLYGSVATVWLSTYGVPAADVRALEASWRPSLEARLRT